jgi:hypothetical protein
MEFARTVWVQADIKLIFPAEFKACFGHGIVAYLRA